MDRRNSTIVQNDSKDEDLYPTNHLYFLSPTNPFRRLCVSIQKSKSFEALILLSILVNSIIMALSSPQPNSDKAAINSKLEKLDIYLLGIFCTEAFLKMVSQGLFIHKHSYLRNPWNILDLIFVITGILPYVVKNNTVVWIRIVKMARVFRPLKFVTKIQSLQVLVGTILKSLALLFQVFILVCFVISMYAIVGMSLLKGRFHFTCFLTNTSSSQKSEIWKKDFLCGTNGQQCPVNTTCKEYWLGPNSGATSFDNFIVSCITVFTCITCEGWTDIMYKTFEVKDYSGRYFWIYYYTLNIIGSQFMMNLVCGVLCGGFSKERARISNRQKFLTHRRELEIERLSEKYVNWIDEAEHAAAHEAQEKLQMEQSEGGLSCLAKFMALNSSIRLTLKQVLLSSFFYWLVIFFTFLNSMTIVIQHYRQPQLITDLTCVAHIFFMVFFLMEVCLRLYALGPTIYFSKLSDKFEFVVINMWLVDWVLSKYAGFSFSVIVLHQLQLVRVFKYTKLWGSLKNLKASIFASISSIVSLILLLLIVVVVIALLGMTLFGGVLTKNIPKPRTNFDDFFNAMLAVFQIMSGESWNFVMYEAIKANGGANNPIGLFSSFYFIITTVIGNYVLLNIFLAIALDNISLTEKENNDITSENNKRYHHMLKVLSKNSETNKTNQNPYASKHSSKTRNQSNQDESATNQNILDAMKHGEGIVSDAKMLQLNTLFICFPTNPIRKIAYKIISSNLFNNLTLSLIVISSGLLAIEDPTDPDAQVNKVLMQFDNVFTTYFTLEIMLKIINYGFCLHPGAYCRDIWNCFDLVIVLNSIISIILSTSKTTPKNVKSVLKILRLLRAFRCLKSVNSIPKLKLVIQCIGSSVKNVAGIIAAAWQFFFIFAIMGVQLFAGKFDSCNDETKTYQEECKGSFITFADDNYNLPIEIKREWKTNDFNFNNIGEGLIALFSSSSGERWPNLMHSGIDSQDIDQGPLLNNKIWLSLYFIAFLITISFFFLSLFIGMIIFTFQEKSAKIEGELDRNSRNSLDFAMMSKPQPRFMPEDITSLKYKIWELIESRCWEFFIIVLVTLNSAAMLLEFYDQPKPYEYLMNQINNGLVFMFCLEALIKVFALRCNYFKDMWNLFDLFIVFVGLITFAVQIFDLKPPFDTSIFSLFRALRFIKLMQKFRSLRILIWTFLKSFQALPYIGVLIFICFYIYAIVGMQLFSLISTTHDDDDDIRWSYINNRNNFQTFFSSIQVLYRATSGENWPNIMLACTSKAKCDKSLKAVKADMITCGNDAAYLYFITFILLCSYLMLNLFLAVIMDNFSYLTDDTSKLGPQHLDEVVMVWSDFDPRATGRIKHTELCHLLKEMSPPVGLGHRCPKVLAYERLVRMNMILYDDGSVDFTGFFFALVRTGLNIYTENANLKSNDEALRKMLLTIWPNITKRTLDLVIPRTPQNAKQMTIAKIYTAKIIIHNYKNVVLKNQKDV